MISKRILRITSVFCTVVWVCTLLSPILIRFNSLSDSATRTTGIPILTVLAEESLLFLTKSNEPETRFAKPVSSPGTIIARLPDAVSDRKICSYFFLNEIDYNQPLIQYKLPLSEQTEAG